MVPFNPLAFRLCVTDFYETQINENSVCSYILKRGRALYDHHKESYYQIESASFGTKWSPVSRKE